MLECGKNEKGMGEKRGFGFVYFWASLVEPIYRNMKNQEKKSKTCLSKLRLELLLMLYNLSVDKYKEIKVGTISLSCARQVQYLPAM